MTNVSKEDTEAAFNRINSDLATLSDWANRSFMEFNPDKTKYMVVSSDIESRTNPTLELNGTDLEKVHNYPQLGLYLNDKMNWEEHINHAINKANKKMGVIWKLSKDIPRYAVENIYTSYIRPHLEYCCIIYNNCTAEQSECLESVQRRAAMACTRAFNRTNSVKLLQELGWPTLKDCRTYFILVQLYKMIHGQIPSYLATNLPPNQGHHGIYPNRRFLNLVPIHAKKARYYKSFMPNSVRLWNDLHNSVK